MNNACELDSKCSNPQPDCCHSSGWAVAEYVVFYNIVWWLVYWFFLLVSKQSEEWCCRLVTFCHACIISYLSVSDIMVSKEGFDFQCIPLSENQKTYLSIMLSYFIFDFVWINLIGNESWVIHLHHISSIVIILKIMISNFGGVGISYGVAGLEITNPYLQARWFLRTHGYLNKPIHTVVELWFFFLFMVIRVIGGNILFYYALRRAKSDIVMTLALISIYVVSLVFAWQIIIYFKRKYWNARGRHVTFVPSNLSISYSQRNLDRQNAPQTPSSQTTNSSKNTDPSSEESEHEQIESTNEAEETEKPEE